MHNNKKWQTQVSQNLASVQQHKYTVQITSCAAHLHYKAAFHNNSLIPNHFLVFLPALLCGLASNAAMQNKHAVPMLSDAAPTHLLIVSIRCVVD